MVELLKQLSAMKGVSGKERNAGHKGAELFLPYCDRAYVDDGNNVVAIKYGEKNEQEQHKNKIKVMLCAHLDEVGFIVTDITPQGFLKIKNVGGLDAQIMPSTQVIVHGREEVLGVVRRTKPTRAYSSNKAVGYEDLLIDVGYPPHKVKQLIDVGAAVTFAATAEVLNQKWFSAKTLDDRACVAIMVECAKHFSAQKSFCDLCFVSTSREETGAQGAVKAALDLKPDLAIVFDVGQAKSGDTKNKSLMECGKGPYITIGPQLDQKYTGLLKQVAKNNHIPHQLTASSGWTGTDASALQVLNGGIPCVLLGVALRYMHTPIEQLYLGDLEDAVTLTCLFIEALTQKGKGYEQA